MKQFEILRKMSGPYNLNTYYIVCKKTKKALVVDPGGTAGEVIGFMKSHRLTPDKVLLTHGHADQFFSMAAFKKAWPVPYGLHKADDAFFKDPKVQQQTKKEVDLPPPYPADLKLADGDTIQCGKVAVKVIHTPGHTPGSACFLCGDRLLTGDAIFVGEAGRTDLPGGDLPTLIESIRTKILPLDKKTMILPGHHHTGDPSSSTLEQEMKTNIYITDFILEA